MENPDNTTEREIVSTRTFNFSREKVFTAWTNAEQVKQWWGPNGFTNTIHHFEPQAGGNWEFTMHGPDGKDYHNRNIFAEIVKPERIIFDHIEPVHLFRVIATFEDLQDKTKLVFRMVFASPAEYKRVKDFIYQANEENFDRLETLLQKTK